MQWTAVSMEEWASDKPHPFKGKIFFDHTRVQKISFKMSFNGRKHKYFFTSLNLKTACIIFMNLRIKNWRMSSKPSIINCYDLKGHLWEKMVDSMLDVMSTHGKNISFLGEECLNTFFLKLSSHQSIVC